MKKFILGLSLIVTLIGCSEPGHVYTPKVESLNINGKLYNIRHVSLSSGGSGIYILFPQDSTVEVPLAVNWTEGKSDQKTVVFIK